MSVIHVLIADGIAHAFNASHFGRITILLGIDEHIKIEVKHILIGPHLETVTGTVSAITSWRCHRQGYLILIVVVLHIGTKADKQRDVTIAQVGLIIDGRLVVNKHLQALVGTQVKVGVAVHTTGVASIQVINLELHGLLIELGDL